MARWADGVETPLFADFDPPQNFALRSDESSVNERQMAWRSRQALQAWPARAQLAFAQLPHRAARPYPCWTDPSSRRASECEQKAWRNHGFVKLMSQGRLVTRGAATHSISTTAVGPKRC